MSPSPLRRLDRERGSTLLIAMIMIFMLSIMGVSAMRGSSLEKRMTLNAIQSSTTFQAADSTSDIVASSRAYLEIASAAPDAEHDLQVPEIRDGIGMDLSATIEQTGEGFIPGYSSGFSGYYYRIQSTASVPNVDARARVEQGIIQPAPGR